MYVDFGEMGRGVGGGGLEMEGGVGRKEGRFCVWGVWRVGRFWCFGLGVYFLRKGGGLGAAVSSSW